MTTDRQNLAQYLAHGECSLKHQIFVLFLLTSLGPWVAEEDWGMEIEVWGSAEQGSEHSGFDLDGLTAEDLFWNKLFNTLSPNHTVWPKEGVCVWGDSSQFFFFGIFKIHVLHLNRLCFHSLKILKFS